MPEYAGFTTSLTSQYDAATIPETHVRIVTTPTLRSLDLRPVACDSPALTEHPDKTFASRRNSATSTVVEAYVPVLPSSQFWICYECPVPSHSGDESEGTTEDGQDGEQVKYYYFQLFVSGSCVLSWGVGAQERWKGKTMFGLFDGGRDFEGRRIVEKRGPFFPPADVVSGEDGFEIRIFRAKARRREGVRYQGLGEVLARNADGEGGRVVDFTGIGRSQGGERKIWFAYALIDARDEPYLTVRYRFEVDDEDLTPRIESTLLSTDVDDATDAETAEVTETSIEANESSLWSELEQNTPPPNRTSSDDKSSAKIRRLSFPPRNQLLPSIITRKESWPSPTKHQASASDDDLARPRTQVNDPSPRRTTGLRKPDWTAVRPASPAEGGEGATLATHRKSGSTSGSGGLLRSVVASALRRKEERGSK